MAEARGRKLPLDELQERARTRVQKAWQEQMPGYEMPTSVRDSMVLGTSFDGDERVFQLYIAGERPEDAVVLAQAIVNQYTGDGPVTIFKDRLPN